MKLLHISIITVLLSTVGWGQESPRFSKTLSVPELASTGVTRLSSDQVAILDALVRRDISRSHLVSPQPRPAQFTERLTTDERNNAGLILLSADQISALDSHVERLINPPVESPGASLVTSGQTVTPAVKIRREMEIHGEVSLMVGAGSHGYSEMGGSVAVTAENPSHTFLVGISYSEIRTKGGYYRRDYLDGYPWNYPDRMW